MEPAVFLLAEAIEGPNVANIGAIASVDLANAFNDIARPAMAAGIAKYAPTLYRAAAWSYGAPSVLVTLAGHAIASAQGGRQGDPLCPLLFSLTFRPTLEAI